MIFHYLSTIAGFIYLNCLNKFLGLILFIVLFELLLTN